MAKQKRFLRTYTQGKTTGFEIWVDCETGVQYLFGFAGYGVGLTPLLGADGAPVITPKEELEKLAAK